MKCRTALLFCFGLWVNEVVASSPIVIEIETRAEKVRYAVNRAGKSADEIEAFVRELIVEFGQPGEFQQSGVEVRPDARTSVQTVFALMRRLQNAGLQRWYLVVRKVVQF